MAPTLVELNLLEKLHQSIEDVFGSFETKGEVCLPLDILRVNLELIVLRANFAPGLDKKKFFDII
jgi:hypothetical protein